MINNNNKIIVPTHVTIDIGTETKLSGRGSNFSLLTAASLDVIITTGYLDWVVIAY